MLLGVEAAVSTVVVPAATAFVVPAYNALAVMLAFESRRTTLLAPLDVATPVPPFATGNIPVTPVLNGRPVALVNVPALGVPKAPLNVTGAPVLPMLFWSALATPVPRLPIEVTGTVVEAVMAPVPFPYT